MCPKLDPHYTTSGGCLVGCVAVKVRAVMYTMGMTQPNAGG